MFNGFKIALVKKLM